jgi:hypothetical protein
VACFTYNYPTPIPGDFVTPKVVRRHIDTSTDQYELLKATAAPDI